MSEYLVGPRIKLVKFIERYITVPYLGWLNDNTVNRYLCTGRLPVTKEDVFAPTNEKDLLFAILSKLTPDCSGKLIDDNNGYINYIGTISLHGIDWIVRKGEVGYMIGDKYHWGCGIATEAVGLVTDYGFNRLNLNKITAGVVKGNEGSAKVILKNGYKQYGTVPKDYYLEGKYLDTERFYKLQEWHDVLL